MRFKIITNVLGLIVEVVSLFMLLPLGWAVLDKSPDVRPIFISMMIGVTLGAILLLIGGRLSR
ncbi:MAG: TrkH family potassium uptake protein, partial [Acetomicrobium sp.]